MKIKTNLSRFILSSLVVAGLLCVSSARAAFTDNFDTLLAELQARSLALSNSTDKVEIKQKKACNKAIKAIVKEGKNLSADIKTAGKVAKTLEKAFTNEFGVVTLVVTTNLETLVQSLFEDLTADVQTALAEVQTALDALPEGTSKTQAQEALDAATALLAQSPESFADAAKLLASGLKNVIKSAKIVEKASGGNSGGGDFMTATVKIGANASFKWDADAFNPMWVQGPGNFQVNGVRGTDSEMTIAFTGFTPATGTYPLGSGNGDYVVFSPLAIYSVTSGTLTLTTVDIANKTVAGTFSFTASDGATTVTVSNGQFKMTNLMTL